MSPRARKWLTAGIVIAVIVGGFWGYRAIRRARLRAEIEGIKGRLRAMGMPVSIDDLRGNPAEDEAALLFEDVYDRIKPKLFPEKSCDNVHALRDFISGKANDPAENEKAVRTIVTRCKPFYDALPRLLRHERRRFTIEWEQRFSADLRYLSKLRHLTHLILARAALDLRNSRVDCAAYGLADALALIRMQREPIGICFLVNCVCEGEALDQLCLMLKTGRLREAQLAGIDRALGALETADHCDEATWGEFVMRLDALRNFVDGRMTLGQIMGAPPSDLSSKALWNFYARMLMDQDGERDVWRVYEQLAAQRDKPACRRTINLNKIGRSNAVWYFFADLISYPTGEIRYAEEMARMVARERMAREAIAAERFRLVHGRWPEKVQLGLADPFTGEPLRYEITDEKLRIWSVGANRQDNNGECEDDSEGKDDIGWTLSWQLPETRETSAP